MTDERTSMRGAGAALIIAVFLVSANMRPTITAFGPLLDQIGEDTGMSLATLGVVASIPLAIWAVVSPFAFDLSRRFGMSRLVAWALVILTVGTIARSLPGTTVNLWLGTAIIGIGIAVMNVLMPAIVKRDFPTRVPLMLALVSALMAASGALASGVAVPLSRLGDESSGWRLALLLTGGALLPFALAAWAWATRGHRAAHLAARAAAPPGSERTRIWADPLAWQVATYMGLQTSIFYMVLTWLASISTSIGRDEVVAGFDVMIFLLMSVTGSLLMAVVYRGHAERIIPGAIPAVGMLGVIGLIIAPHGVVVWAVLLGLYAGASLSVSFTLMAQRARTASASAALSGMSQSVGYVIAAAGPAVFGWLHSVTAGWMLSLTLIAVAMVGQGIAGALAGRPRFVLADR